jgi:hypothetical protein
MGEMAFFGTDRVKIGTCENMYYLRFDQARMVRRSPCSLDPADPAIQAEIRFRFPWPDEDGTEPGAYDGDYDRGVSLYGVQPPAGVQHDSVQFTARQGYVMSLPCPEGQALPAGVTVHRNGFPGPVRIVQQGWRNGHLAVICQCGGCGARYNLPTWEEAEPLVVACRAQADKQGAQAPTWWHAVADRIAAGYGK